MEPVVPRFRPAHPSEDRSGILQEITTQSLSNLSSNRCFSREFLKFLLSKTKHQTPPTPQPRKGRNVHWERHIRSKKKSSHFASGTNRAPYPLVIFITKAFDDIKQPMERITSGARYCLLFLAQTP